MEDLVKNFGVQNQIEIVASSFVKSRFYFYFLIFDAKSQQFIDIYGIDNFKTIPYLMLIDEYSPLRVHHGNLVITEESIFYCSFPIPASILQSYTSIAIQATSEDIQNVVDQKSKRLDILSCLDLPINQISFLYHDVIHNLNFICATTRSRIEEFFQILVQPKMIFERDGNQFSLLLDDQKILTIECRSEEELQIFQIEFTFRQSQFETLTLDSFASFIPV